ncbi:MAG: hypothetical protein ACLGXA_10645 [Acidobacteriota bacterium]
MMILGCVVPAAAQIGKLVPAEGDVRFSEQISNGPAGNCGCFAMEGFAAGASWNLHEVGRERSTALGFVTDLSVEHTGKVSNAPYGLTLTTIAFGPRVATRGFKSTRMFAQILFGFTHGSNSEFPVRNSLESSANSSAFMLGGGVDRPITQRISYRIIQLQYLRTSLPNDTSNRENNLQVSTGLRFLFGK